MMIDNCVMASSPNPLLLVFLPSPFKQQDLIRLTRNTLLSGRCSMQFLPLPAGLSTKGQFGLVRVEPSGNLFDAPSVLELVEPNDFALQHKALPPKEALSLLQGGVAWHDRQNLYAISKSYLQWYIQSEGESLPTLKNLADWKKFWSQPKADAQEGRVRYQGGNLVSKLSTAPDKLTPEDFRLRPDSAGYRAGKDGKDLGADVDLVGPGKAYERWKKTPEYQQWLRETGQKK